MENIEAIKEILKKYNQEHLLMFYNELNLEQQSKLLKDILTIDFKLIKDLQSIGEKADNEIDIQPIKATLKESLSKEKLNYYIQKGRDIIKSSRYAIVTMAGGQGTRLGHDGPKGTFSLNLKNGNKYIFEIFVDYLKEVYYKYAVYIPWYIMTSKDNNKQTIDFFEEHNYFGYPKENIQFFMQGELPITDLNGNVVLESKDKILKAADGNGGVFNALFYVLEDMKLRGIEWVLITGIDNILVNLADELYIGLVDSENKLNGVKSVAKNSPEEKVGVFCKRNGRPSVIEYTEMNDEMRSSKDKNGEFKYIDANIVNHIINIKILEKIQNGKLPIHKAIKKMNYIDKKRRF